MIEVKVFTKKKKFYTKHYYETSNEAELAKFAIWKLGYITI